MARGVLAGKNRKSTRQTTDRGITLFFKTKAEENTQVIVDRLEEVANKKGLAPARVRKLQARQQRSN